MKPDGSGFEELINAVNRALQRNSAPYLTGANRSSLPRKRIARKIASAYVVGLMRAAETYYVALEAVRQTEGLPPTPPNSLQRKSR